MDPKVKFNVDVVEGEWCIASKAGNLDRLLHYSVSRYPHASSIDRGKIFREDSRSTNAHLSYVSWTRAVT